MSLHVYNDLAQGSEEWHAARRGIVTASVVGKLLTIGAPDALEYACPDCSAPAGASCISRSRKEPTPIKTVHDKRTSVATESAKDADPVIEVADNDSARGLVATLTAERIAGFTEDIPMNGDMWRGVTAEPFAREFYAKHSPSPVVEVGFMVEDRWGFRIGYSPDGLVGDEGLLEIKAPRSKTHLQTVLADNVPAYNMAQLQTGLLVSGRKWIDFVPFVGGLPLWSKRVYPDPSWHEAIVAAVAKFETTAAEMVAAYNATTDGLPVTERIDTELGLVF